MSHFKGRAETELAQEYFFNLVRDAGVAPPPGLDPETARLVRELVEAELRATPVDGLNFTCTRQRIRQRVRPPAGVVDSQPAFQAGESFHGSAPVLVPSKRITLSREKFATLAGMAATIVLLVGLLGLSLAGVRPPEAPAGSSAIPPTVQAVQTTPPVPPPTLTPSPTVRQFTRSAADLYNPKMLLQNALVEVAKGLNLDPDTLFARLEKGETLGGIAKQQGVDVESLKKMILAGYESQLDAAVKSGELTQAQADEVVNSSVPFIDNFITNSTITTTKIPPTK